MSPGRRPDDRKRPHLGLRDAFDEAIAGLYARPFRTLLTLLGTVLGVTSLVATIGLSQTANNQIQDRFDAATATRITIQPPPSNAAQPAANPLPWDAEQRLRRLNGINNVAATATIKTNQAVSSTRLRDPTNASEIQIPILATTPGLAATTNLSVAAGRFIDPGDLTRIDNVAVIGADAARQLHITRVATRPAIYIGDDPYTVIGILTPDNPTYDFAVLLPATTAQHRYNTLNPDQISITTRLGATTLIAHQAPLALNPTHPDQLTVLTPANPDTLRQAIHTDINILFLALAALALVISTIGIANVTLVNVLERQPELALRRALGASPTNIATHILLEATLTGLAGGLTGTTLGALTITITAAVRSWTPTLDPHITIAAPAVGLACGLTAGIWPALRAARTEPTTSLR